MVPVARIVIHSPSGEWSTVDMRGDVMTIGRPTPQHRPDIALEPDPRQWVGRRHCSLEMVGGVWEAVDGGTVNGTLLHRESRFERLDQPTRLLDGDEMLILGDVTADGDPRYWRLAFHDPHSTRSASVLVRTAEAGGTAEADPPCLEYDWSSARVYLRSGGRREEVHGLRPKAHDLVRFMMERAAGLGAAAVMCTHDEILQALFGDRSTWPYDRAHTEQDVRDVVSDVRKAVEPDRSHPVVLQTVRGKGYRIAAWLPS